MAGNAIAWKEEFTERQLVRRVGWLGEVWHLLNALRLVVAADRVEGQEQARVAGGLRKGC